MTGPLDATPDPHARPRPAARRARRGVAAGAAVLALFAGAAACGGSGTDGAADDAGGGAGGGEEAGGGEGTGGEGGGTATTAAAGTFPGDEWARTDPAAAGFDPAALEALAAEAEAAGSNCLLVARDGEVVGEWYWNGTDAGSSQEVFSTTKSVTSTLVGLAQEDGALEVTDPASEYIAEWQGTPSEDVTVANLLSNDSGREWDPGIDYGQLPGAPDRSGLAVGLGQDGPPGTIWAYNNAAIQTLEPVLREATGEDVADYADERLFTPIGMDDSEMTEDSAGHAATFFGMKTTCEDLARYGHLYLNGGRWGDEQVVPADWVDASVGAPSQELNAAYGYLWWLNRRGPIASPAAATTADQSGGSPDGQLVAGAPEDMFFALGLGNQITAVDPGSGTVVVRLGGGSSPDGADPFDTADAARVVTEALVRP